MLGTLRRLPMYTLKWAVYPVFELAKTDNLYPHWRVEQLCHLRHWVPNLFTWAILRRSTPLRQTCLSAPYAAAPECSRRVWQPSSPVPENVAEILMFSVSTKWFRFHQGCDCRWGERKKNEEASLFSYGSLAKATFSGTSSPLFGPSFFPPCHWPLLQCLLGSLFFFSRSSRGALFRGAMRLSWTY